MPPDRATRVFSELQLCKQICSGKHAIVSVSACDPARQQEFLSLAVDFDRTAHEIMLHMKCCCRVFQSASNPDDMCWLPAGKINIAESALCNRQADATAIVWAEESLPNQLATVSWGELKHRCQHVAAALIAAGFEPGLPQSFIYSDIVLRCCSIVQSTLRHRQRVVITPAPATLWVKFGVSLLRCNV